MARSSVRSTGLLLTTALVLAPSLAAQGIEGAATGLTGPVFTLTFSEFGLPMNAVITNQYAVYGVTFDGLYQDPQPGLYPDPSLGNFTAGGTVNRVVTLWFSGPVTGAAFNMATNPGTSSFEAFLGATSQHSFSTATDLVDPFLWFGFEGIAFDRIVITPGGTNWSFLMDNLQLDTDLVDPSSTVPEPASMTLLATGLAGLAAARRRKHKKS